MGTGVGKNMPIPAEAGIQQSDILWNLDLRFHQNDASILLS